MVNFLFLCAGPWPRGESEQSDPLLALKDPIFPPIVHALTGGIILMQVLYCLTFVLPLVVGLL